MHRHLPALNQCSLHRYRDEDARFPNIAVIEEIVSARFESISVQQPSAKRYLQPELMLLIPLPPQGHKTGVVGVRILQYRTGNAGKRRGLIKVAIKTTEYPAKFRDEHGSANPRINRILNYSRLHMRLPQAADQR